MAVHMPTREAVEELALRHLLRLRDEGQCPV